MFDDMENIKIISSYAAVTTPCGKMKNRKYNTFIYRTSGANHINFEDRQITVRKGEMIFFPQGCSYSHQVIPGEECRYISINFEANLTDPKPTLYSMEHFPEANYIFNYISSVWKVGSTPEKFKCLSLFYSLLTYVSGIEHMDYAYKKKAHLIEPAVSYLKAHIFDANVKADSLHLLCGISDTYFRKIFSSNFGTTPQKYIISKRMAQAKSIIDNGDFYTISQVAQAVGYSDSLYFSKVFKLIYGVSPTDFSRLSRKP